MNEEAGGEATDGLGPMHEGRRHVMVEEKTIQDILLQLRDIKHDVRGLRANEAGVAKAFERIRVSVDALSDRTRTLEDYNLRGQFEKEIKSLKEELSRINSVLPAPVLAALLEDNKKNTEQRTRIELITKVILVVVSLAGLGNFILNWLAAFKN